jgi:SAM-dependent methyltransferase
MSAQIDSQNILIRCARYAAKKFNSAYLRSKYRGDACAMTVDWAWEKTNYNRIALVNFLLSRKREPAYLEIGCNTNDLFDSVPCENKIGVDPALGGNVRATSDEFFATNRQFFDVVFIDGLHTYEQVRRDVLNSIRFLKPGGYVALHDMLPGSWLESHVPRISGMWTGDVWKAAFEISQSKGIDFKIVKIDHGVGVLRVTDENWALADLSKELQDKQFDFFHARISKLPLIEWQDFLAWVG